MLVVVKAHKVGYYTAQPVSKVWKKLYCKHMREMGQVVTSQAFFQNDDELPETIKRNRQYGEIQRGWHTVIRVDPWEYGHWLGYDAHLVSMQARPWK